jgi:carboxypeptidase-like protein
MQLRRHFAAALLVAALSSPAFLVAQNDSTAIIRGTASSSFNGHPLVGVMISVPALQRFTVSDSTGRFELARLPAGQQRIRISYEGRATVEYTFELKQGKTKRLSVLLDVEALDLAPVVVEAQNPDFSRNLAGFYDRKKWYGGFARFYTREDIAHTSATRVSSLLARDGVFVRCGAVGCVPMMWSRGTLCAVAVAIDGMPFGEQDYDDVQIDEVQAVEVYRNNFFAPTVPYVASFTPPGFGGSIRTCASVLIWTR